ncbi:MAG: HDOD domain-containing protein [bacterium]
MTNNLKNLIETMPNLPSMPNIVSEALNIIEDPKSNINKLSEVISKDISITTEILKLVNSAYYGFPAQITSINKAMALLGFSKVKSLIMSVAVKPMMMSTGGKSLWEHSVRCAVGSEILAKSLGKSDTDEAFIMGLLHDIGKTVLEIYNKDASKEITRLVGLGADRLAAEKMIFGFQHTEIGEQLVQKWKLPSLIGSSVKYHHEPQNSDNITMVGCVYVADKTCQDLLKYPILDPDITEIFDFEIPDPMQLRDQIFEKSQHIIAALSK